MEAAARARRARAVEELRRLSRVVESDGTPAETGLSTVVESDEKPEATEQECDHFSLRGYVAMLQKKKDPRLCTNVFQYDQHHDSTPIFVSKHHRWDCSKCLDKLKVSGHRPTSANVSMEQHGMNNGCSVPHMTHPSMQNVDPACPLGQTASPPAEETRSEVASNL